MATKKARKKSDPVLEPSRTQFRSLISANPNHFGNAGPSKFEQVELIASNTSFEEITSIGYNPQTSRLFATLDIKKSAGYVGDMCETGSTEHVRFFVNFGAGWNDAGVAATDVHNTELDQEQDCAGNAIRPLTYSVEQPFSPPRRWCTSPQLPKVRAILSWNLEPPAGNANWNPVFGNVLDCAIQIDRSWWWKDFFVELGIATKLPAALLDSVQPMLPPKPQEPDLPEPRFPGTADLPPNKPVALSLGQLIEEYSTAKASETLSPIVPPSRFAYSALRTLQADPTNGSSVGPDITSLFKPEVFNPAEVFADVNSGVSDTTYEELVTVGLDFNRQKLDATFRVKKPSGYSGPLCTAGSPEYVAFWADWDDNCEWDYIETVSVTTHDFRGLPKGGLCYTASLPVDLTGILDSCKTPKVARIRAVLSWAVAPSKTNPNAMPRWGNQLDAHVLLPSRDYAPGQLTVVGGVSVSYISNLDGQTVPGAKFVDSGNIVDGQSRSCPFGGTIIVRGTALENRDYRIRVIDNQGASQTLTEKIWITPTIGLSSYHAGNPDGWFSYLPHEKNFEQVLGYFRSSGNGLVTIQLEVEGEGIVDSQVVQLDNTKPDVAISITAPGADCDQFERGVLLEGLVTATDNLPGGDNIGSWKVVIDGGPAAAPNTVVANVVAGTKNTPIGGQGWQFDTKDLGQCGYVVRVTATDRTIVGSGPSHNSATTDVGFCVIE